MSWQFTPYTPVLLLSTLVWLLLAGLGWRYRDEPGSKPFVLMTLGGAVYAGGYLLQLSGTTLAWQQFWLGVQYVGTVAIPASLLAFALAYTGRREWLTRRTVVLLGVEPAITLVLVWTNAGNLFRSDPRIVDVGSFVHLSYAPGPWFWVDIVYTYALVLASFALFLDLYVRSRSIYRRQAAAILSGITFALVAGVYDFFGPAHLIDPTPLVFTLSGIALAWGIFQSELLDVVPIPARTVLEAMHGGVVVLDAGRRVVDLNESAGDLLAADGEVIGRPADELAVGASGDVDVASLADGDEIRTRSGGEDRHFEVRVTPITDDRGVERGRLVILYDVSRRKRYEHTLEAHNRQLEVLNRILRHDIRNDANVALGWGSHLRDRLDDPEATETLDRILRSNEHVVELTRVAADLADALENERFTSLQRVDLPRVLRGEVEKLRESNPDAEVVLDDDLPEVTVEANELLGSVFRNLLSNAIRHNDKDTPRVEVAAAIEDGQVAVSVADNGPGIPDARKETVFGEGEKGMDSPGTGLGLYLVDSLVGEFGGDVAVTDNEPEGAVFTVTLPTAAPDRNRPDGNGLCVEPGTS